MKEQEDKVTHARVWKLLETWRFDLKGSIIIKRERERYKWAHKKRPRSARFKAHVSSQYPCAVLKLAKAKPKAKSYAVLNFQLLLWKSIDWSPWPAASYKGMLVCLDSNTWYLIRTFVTRLILCLLKASIPRYVLSQPFMLPVLTYTY